MCSSDLGGGPAGLAAAIHAADLAKAAGNSALRILLLEKGVGFGEHSLSGAVIKTGILKTLLPDVSKSDDPFESPGAKIGRASWRARGDVAV